MSKTIKVIKRGEIIHCEASSVPKKPDCRRAAERDISKTINSWVSEYRLNKTANQSLISKYFQKKIIYETAKR